MLSLLAPLQLAVGVLCDAAAAQAGAAGVNSSAMLGAGGYVPGVPGGAFTNASYLSTEYKPPSAAEVDAYISDLLQINEIIKASTPAEASKLISMPLNASGGGGVAPAVAVEAHTAAGAHWGIDHILAINATAWNDAFADFESERVMRARTGDTFVPEFFNQRQLLGIVRYALLLAALRRRFPRQMTDRYHRRVGSGSVASAASSAAASAGWACRAASPASARSVSTASAPCPCVASASAGSSRSVASAGSTAASLASAAS